MPNHHLQKTTKNSPKNWLSDNFIDSLIVRSNLVFLYQYVYYYHSDNAGGLVVCTTFGYDHSHHIYHNPLICFSYAFTNQPTTCMTISTRYHIQATSVC